MLSTLQNRYIEMLNILATVCKYHLPQQIAIIDSLKFDQFLPKRAVISENLRFTFFFLNLLEAI